VAPRVSKKIWALGVPRGGSPTASASERSENLLRALVHRASSSLPRETIWTNRSFSPTNPPCIQNTRILCSQVCYLMFYNFRRTVNLNAPTETKEWRIIHLTILMHTQSLILRCAPIACEFHILWIFTFVISCTLQSPQKSWSLTTLQRNNYTLFLRLVPHKSEFELHSVSATANMTYCGLSHSKHLLCYNFRGTHPP